uniref:Uncharacterized protein n=1 Tax=Meloidogyne enterolobii TaxID=390850 RepID=A0A6V7YAE9_MELEN|nr:unnamed protein product [Meloidogyne enterolobii]
MSSLPKGTVNIAAGLALVSFGTLMLGVPLMLMDLANFEKEMSQKRQIVEDIGSQMWSTIMEQNVLTRKARAAEITARQRRQYENANVKASPRRIYVLVDLKVCAASQENQEWTESLVL